jgi:hypothetical protein
MLVPFLKSQFASQVPVCDFRSELRFLFFFFSCVNKVVCMYVCYQTHLVKFHANVS